MAAKKPRFTEPREGVLVAELDATSKSVVDDMKLLVADLTRLQKARGFKQFAQSAVRKGDKLIVTVIPVLVKTPAKAAPAPAPKPRGGWKAKR